jgi:hypothetical protein
MTTINTRYSFPEYKHLTGSVASHLTPHPNGKTYISATLQAIYNYCMTVSKIEEEEINLIMTQETLYLTLSEFKFLISDGSISRNNIKYTINWAYPVSQCLKSEKLVLLFRTPKQNCLIAPRVLVAPNLKDNYQSN